MKPKQLLLTCLLALVGSMAEQKALAYDAKIDGIFYYLSGSEATVTSGDYKYTGPVKIPSSITYNGETYSVTSIGGSAFVGCTSLTSITIPNSVTSIGDYAFSNCTGLTSITIPNSVTSIGNSAFSGCSGLTSITIPNSVTNIGEWAFNNCNSLTSVTLPENITSINDFTFQYCSRLKSLTIPNSVTRIGGNAFLECGLTSITLPENLTSIGGSAFYGCSGLKSVTIPNSVTNMGGSVFFRCLDLTSVTLSESLTSIGDYTFAECSELTSIIIPNGVTSIGWNAFNKCLNLTSVSIPQSVTYIEYVAFSYCQSLTDVYCYAENVPTTESSAFNDSRIASATLHVPAASLQTYRTTSPWSGFGTIVAINNIDFADANVKAICVANWDTDGDGELSKVEAAAVTDLGDVFMSNTEITSFNELQYFTGLTSIGDWAFCDCSGLTSVTIPNSVTSIGGGAFECCTSLTSVTIPNSVTSIGDYAFQECSSLTSVKLPESLTNIGDGAFYECSGLTSITIPKGVTSIGEYAFYGAKLRNILIKCVTPPDALENDDPAGRYDGTFSRQSMRHATLYVPSGCWETYAFDENWFVFNNIRETATEEAQLSMQQAYTLMDAGTFTYSVYDPVNDRISSVNVINEDNPNHCWQVIDVDGERYLYNIGAKKFVTTAGDYMRLSGNATSIEMQNGNDGIVLGEQKGRQWAFVNNDNMNVEDAIADMIKGITPTSPEEEGQVYNLAGQRLSKPQKGINIVNGKKVLIK